MACFMLGTVMVTLGKYSASYYAGKCVSLALFYTIPILIDKIFKKPPTGPSPVTTKMVI